MSFEKLSPDRQLLINLIRLALVLYLSFIILDLIIYPDYIFPLVLIRVGVSGWLMFIHQFVYKLTDKQFFSICPLLFIPTAMGITLMCLVVGEGFASVYFTGNMLIFIASAFFVRINMFYYTLTMLTIFIQHFIILAFIPFALKDFMANFFFLGSATILSLFLHSSLARVREEINSLKGLLPICMYCKKIRNDTGYWDQVEQYVSRRSEVHFSHSICPECMEKNIESQAD